LFDERENMRIILAMPDVDLRLATQLLLSEEPNVKIVGTASNTAGVLALTQTTSVDLLFLDWELDGCSMQELTEKIYQDQPKIEMIIFVNRTSLLSTPLKPGVRAYLLKGEPPDKLLQLYRKILSDRKNKTSVKPNPKEEDAS
jgi:DNA-binding NarL/FixJ family response regulator